MDVLKLSSIASTTSGALLELTIAFNEPHGESMKYVALDCKASSEQEGYVSQALELFMHG